MIAAATSRAMRCTAILRSIAGASRANAEQAQCERGDRAPAWRLAEIENLRRVHADAALDGGAANRVHQTSLADAGFAAHDDGATVATAVQRSSDARIIASSGRRPTNGCELVPLSWPIACSDQAVTGSACACNAAAARCVLTRSPSDCANRFGDQNLVHPGPAPRACAPHASAGRSKETIRRRTAPGLARCRCVAPASRCWTGQGLAGDHVAQHQRGARRAFGFVAVRIRHAEHGEHIRADAAIGQAAELLHALLHAALKFVGEQCDFFGIELRFSFQQTFKPRDEDRRIAQLAAGIPGASGSLRAAIASQRVRRASVIRRRSGSSAARGVCASARDTAARWRPREKHPARDAAHRGTLDTVAAPLRRRCAWLAAP